jgi:excisionase family DNA binding protein
MTEQVILMDFIEPLLTVSEAAVALGVEASTIRGWRQRGEFPSLFRKIGGKVLIPRRELESLIERGKNRTAVGSTTKGTR